MKPEIPYKDFGFLNWRRPSQTNSPHPNQMPNLQAYAIFNKGIYGKDVLSNGKKLSIS